MVAQVPPDLEPREVAGAVGRVEAVDRDQRRGHGQRQEAVAGAAEGLEHVAQLRQRLRLRREEDQVVRVNVGRGGQVWEKREARNVS